MSGPLLTIEVDGETFEQCRSQARELARRWFEVDTDDELAELAEVTFVEARTIETAVTGFGEITAVVFSAQFVARVRQS